jgi:tryptophanyl-tRNA synthetase
VIAELAPVQERYAALLADPVQLADVLADGADRARAVARDTLARVYDAVGFLPPAGAAHW